MSEDPRCCGSGTCIIDTEGRCWCGQRWDGQKMGPASQPHADGPGRADVAGPPPASTCWRGGHLSLIAEVT